MEAYDNSKNQTFPSEKKSQIFQSRKDYNL
jgi:hypothetical protein